MVGQVNMLNKHTPLITIALPTLNRADNYLRQALESARTQTYQNLDIIVADNCSVDDTETLVAGIGDPRIRYFKHHTNIGANNNFNFCLREAQGEYFILLSDDDLIDKDFVEVCVNARNSKTDFGIMITGNRLIDANNQLIRETPNMVEGFSTDGFFRGWFTGKIALYLCSTLFHTQRLREVGGFRSKHNLYDDVMAQVQLAAKYGRVDIQDIKASARVHESKMAFAAEINEWCEDALILLDLMCELAPENREQLRHEGMRFFSRGNYHRASVIKSPTKRFLAYMIVLKKFGYRHPPSLYPQRFHPRRLWGIKTKMKRMLSMNS